MINAAMIATTLSIQIRFVKYTMVNPIIIPIVVRTPVHYMLRRRPARSYGLNASADLAGLPEVRVEPER